MLSGDGLSTSNVGMSGASDASTAVVKSADRVLAILDLLAESGPLTFAAVCSTLGVPRSSAHAILQTMEARSYVARTAGTYSLGSRVWEVAQRWGAPDLRTAMRPSMLELARRTEETVQAAQLEGADAFYLEVCESLHPVKLSSRPGARLPAHASGVGKVLLAQLDVPEARRRLSVGRLEALTPKTLTDPEELLVELERIRKRGYAIDDEEFAIGLHCVAMPVRSASGEVVAALSVAMPEPRYSRAIATQNREALAETVAEVERVLAGAR
jgi:DNA-binding IclR family transcriptional regulator